MNALVEQHPVSASTLEHVLGTGDLSKLSTQQRVEFYAKTCQSLGLNPLTRPFRFMSFQGNTVMYATRDCTDQLRKVNGITLHVVDKQLDGELFIVTVRARDKHGREDEDMGAVTLGTLRGESRANALMKALTKAKRRVTLSICGLGLTDEAELDTMPGATTFDADEPPPVAPIRSAAADMPRPAKVTEERPRTRREVLDATRLALRDAQTAEEADRIICGQDVARARATFTNGHKTELETIISEAMAKWWPEPSDADAAHEPEPASA